MDQDTQRLIRELCTRAGTVMEDASVTALVWSGRDDLHARLDQLDRASQQIGALVAAAKALV